jgi:hypothetical protein
MDNSSTSLLVGSASAILSIILFLFSNDERREKGDRETAEDNGSRSGNSLSYEMSPSNSSSLNELRKGGDLYGNNCDGYMCQKHYPDVMKPSPPTYPRIPLSTAEDNRDEWIKIGYVQSTVDETLIFSLYRRGSRDYPNDYEYVVTDQHGVTLELDKKLYYRLRDGDRVTVPSYSSKNPFTITLYTLEGSNPLRL